MCTRSGHPVRRSGARRSALPAERGTPGILDVVVVPERESEGATKRLQDRRVRGEEDTAMAVGQYETFTEAVRDMISGERFERAAELARRYWQEPFTGRYFHVVADSDHRDEITERDIVAV